MATVLTTERAPASGVRAMVRNVGGRLIHDSAAIVARIVLTLALVRFAGPRDLGLLVLTSTIAGLAFLPAAAGLDGWTALEGARRRVSDGPAPAAEALRLSVVTSLAVAAALVAGGFVLGVPLVGVGSALLTLVTVPGWVLRAGFSGAGRLGLIGWVGTVEGIVTLTVGIGALLAGAGVAGAVAGLVAGRTANLGASAVLFTRHVGTLRGPRTRSIRRLLREAAPFAPMRALTVGLQRVDTLVLGALVGASAVGIYGAATNVTLTVPLIASALAEATLPRLVHADADRAANALLRMCGLMAIPVSLGVIVTAPVLVTLAYGPGFDEAVGVPRVLGLAIPFVFVSTALAITVVAQGRTGWRTSALVAAVLFNVAANIALIPSLGVIGVAWATLGAEVVHAGVLVAAIRRTPIHLALRGGWSPRTALQRVA